MTDQHPEQPPVPPGQSAGTPDGPGAIPPVRPTAVFDPARQDHETTQTPPDPPHGDPHPTLRFDPAGTSPDAPNRATSRFEPETTYSSANLLDLGEWIADRYRVEAAISVQTGEAEIYQCLDTVSGDRCILKLYHPRVRPKEDVLNHLVLLRHPCIVALRDYGIWKGRFFEVMDYCCGGSLDARMPFTEQQLTRMLPDLVQGLRFLHNAGIIHRDIKPSNLFFRDEEGHQPVIGDFGISSKLDREENVRRTTTAQFMTLDYAAPELIDGKEISEKTDYYALGITLIHLLNGRSPFYGMDVNTILGCHFRGRVPMPAGISGRFSQLLSGLLRVDPKTRWGYAQVTSWLRGEPVVEDAAPDSTAESAVKKVPYRSCPAITTPRELALNLDKFDAARDMRRGYISQWLMLFDEELGRKVAELEEAYYDNIEIGLFALKYLLIPGQPLVIGEHQVKSIGELAGLVEKYPNISGAKELEKAFQSGTLEVWIRCLPSKDNTPETLSAKIASIRDRNLKIDTALFALRFTLNPSASFSIGNTRITNLATLAAALSGPGASPQMIAHFIRSGKLLEWFRQKYPEKQPELRAIERIAREAENNPAYAVFCLRCLLNPETPLDVLGVQGVNRPEDFPKFLDKDPSRQQLGIRLLQEGWLRAWLVYTGRLKDPAPLDAILTDPTVSWARKLESVLWLLQPDLPRPVPMADVEELNGGRVGSDRWKPLRVTIFNGSRGTLCGTAWLDTESAGFIMASESFEGGPVTLTVYVSGAGLEPGSRHTARLVVNTNGGDLIIPVHFRVAGEWRSYVLRASGGGLVCGAAFGLLRYLLNPPGFTDASRLPPPPRADILADLLRDFPAERMIGAAFLLSMMLLSAILMVIHAWRVHKQQGNDMNSLADLFPGNHKPRSSVLDEEDDEKKLDHFNL